jgi:pimeloyl-ACP methyl ester carboxylesterase
MDMPERFSRLLVMNTIFGTGDYKLSKGFFEWRAWAKDNPDMSPGFLLKLTSPHLTEEECEAYDAPFPDITYKAGVRRFPQMVPDREDAPGAELSRAARKWFQTEWKGQSFMAVGMKDPVLGPPVMQALRKYIANCPEPFEHPDAGHFVQEWGAEIAEAALAAFYR